VGGVEEGEEGVADVEAIVAIHSEERRGPDVVCSGSPIFERGWRRGRGRKGGRRGREWYGGRGEAIDGFVVSSDFRYVGSAVGSGQRCGWRRRRRRRRRRGGRSLVSASVACGKCKFRAAPTECVFGAFTWDGCFGGGYEGRRRMDVGT